MAAAAEKAEAEVYLKCLVNKTLRIYASDSRLFVGTFKCIDPKHNVILALTYEYRQPSPKKVAEAAAAAAAAITTDPSPPSTEQQQQPQPEMTSRYLGLVVIPGEHIVKLEVEEFVSQSKSRSILERRNIYYGGR